MVFLVAVFTPWPEFESQLRIISGWNKLESMNDTISSLISLYPHWMTWLNPHYCHPPPRYYTKTSCHSWIPYVWCKNPHLWSAKKKKDILTPNTTFCKLKHGKTIRFFPFLHVFFIWILRHPAWRKATRHTLNKAQLTANKGRARTLLQGTTITCVTCHGRTLWSQDVSGIWFFFLDFICVYAWLCANPLWLSLSCTLNLSIGSIGSSSQLMEKKGNFPLHDYQSIVVIH